MIKRIVLVSMPYITPTSPPLGIATLKSCIEKKTGVKVTCMDVNLLFTKYLLKLIKDDPNKRPREAKLLEVSEYLKSDKAYSNETKLKEYLKLFSMNLQIVNINSTNISRDYLEGKRNNLALMEKYVDSILDINPQMIGFSVCYSDQITNSIAMAKRLKNKNPSLKIVFGGPAMQKNSKLLSKISSVIDYIVYNQGEQSLVALIKGDDKNKIPNLIFLKNDHVQINPEENCTSIDTPFADFSELTDYYVPEPVLPVLSAKGCYWRKCAFCVHYHSYSYNYTVKNIKNFIQELQHYNSVYNAKYFYFVDEMVPARRLEKISEEIINSGLKIYYSALVKPNDDFTSNILRKMYESGCRVLLPGIESGNQRILDLINKGTNVASNENFLKRSHEAGIRNACYFFVGFPTETKEELQDTKNFIIRNGEYIDFVLHAKFLLEEGSDIIINPQKYNIRLKGLKRINQKTLINDFEVLSENAIQPESEVYIDYIDFFRNFKGKQYGFGKFREHMLIYYSKKRKI
ncbi:MAG: radical SAM protein [Nanoarchaeota archaeon]